MILLVCCPTKWWTNRGGRQDRTHLTQCINLYASSWLNPSEIWSGSAKILPVSKIFLSIQDNFCPFEFHPLQSLTKAGDTVQFYWIFVDFSVTSIMNKITCNLKTIAFRKFRKNMLFSYFRVSYNIVKFQTCNLLHSWVIATLRLTLLSKSVRTWKLLHLEYFL